MPESLFANVCSIKSTELAVTRSPLNQTKEQCLLLLHLDLLDTFEEGSSLCIVMKILKSPLVA